MNPLEILATVKVKVVGARRLDGRPLPLLGMRPKHHVVDLRGGVPNPHSPLEQALADHGFTRLIPGGTYDKPHPDWTITLPTATSYRVEHQGQVQFRNHLDTPRLWGEFVREAGWCLLVLQREAGPEVHGTELLAEMDAGNCLAVNARLLP